MRARRLGLGAATTAAVAALAIALLAFAGGSGPAGPTATPGVEPTASNAIAGTASSPSPTGARASGSTSSPGAIPSPSASPSVEPSGVDTSGTGSAIIAGSVGRSSLDLNATYDADLRIGWATGTIRVAETIGVQNSSGRPIDRIELNTVAARLGRLHALRVSVDGTAARPAVDDQTIVVPLGGVLPPGKSATVRVGYRATLRSATSGSSWLFAKANGIADLYRWLPWISRRTPFDRPNFGDPFVTPTSPRVTVRITADRPLRYATSGVRVALSGRTQTFEARNVRDFAVTAAPDFVTTSGTVDRVRVDVLTRPGGPARALLAAARRALHAQAALVGRYPYPVFTVTESAGGFGMEAPAAVWIPRGLESFRIPYLVGHETAHQWFYGIVGDDQAREPWTDEAAADFLARYVLGERRASRCPAARLDRSIYDYSSRCYYETVYIQGGNVIDDARRRIGDARFWKALRGYVSANRFAIAHERTLLDALDAATPVDLAARLFAARFPSRY